MPHANSLANLRPPWKAGESGNRAGRPNTGGSLIEYIHELGSESDPGIAKYPLEELKAIGADHRVSHTKAMAAQLLVLARTPGFHEKSGKPYCAVVVDMILDRTVGKPVQSVHVHSTKTAVPDLKLDGPTFTGYAIPSVRLEERRPVVSTLHRITKYVELIVRTFE